MSLFTTLTSLAATTIIENYKQASKQQEEPQPESQTRSHTQVRSVVIEDTERIQDLSPSPPPARSRTTATELPRRRRSLSPRPAMQSSGLPHNSIWTTMAYPIPRGPCLQKSSMISSCSCQRFMVHPLKATTSFDCDGCGHHASFHKMKSHEEEVENAAKYRDVTINSADVSGSVSRRVEMGREVQLLENRVREESVDGAEEDEETLDGSDVDTAAAGRQKRRKLGATRATAASTTAAKRGRKTTAGKRKRAEEVVID